MHVCLLRARTRVLNNIFQYSLVGFYTQGERRAQEQSTFFLPLLHTAAMSDKEASSSYTSYAVTFLAGASYGLTTVVVGQPLDTVKTRMQGLPSASAQSSLSVGRSLFAREGLRGLYRGGLPIFIGGSLMRSAQFGVSGSVMGILKRYNFPEYKVCGIIDCQVIIAGMAGGLGRALIEIPADFLKIRKQVDKGWTLRQVMDGSFVTFGRNSVLFAAFVTYVDLSKQLCARGYIPQMLLDDTRENLSPFAKGALCANLAWLTVWPSDVVKTQRQSGNYDRNTSSLHLLKENIKSGKLFRGLVPGLIRSSISNGSSMVVFEWVERTLSDKFGLQRKGIV